LKPTFTPCSYGYRRQRDAKMASRAIRNDLYQGAWGVVDGSMLRLIKQSLTVGIAYEGKVEPMTVGVRQGSPISPLYSNHLPELAGSGVAPAGLPEETGGHTAPLR